MVAFDSTTVPQTGVKLLRNFVGNFGVIKSVSVSKTHPNLISKENVEKNFQNKTFFSDKANLKKKEQKYFSF